MYMYMSFIFYNWLVWRYSNKYCCSKLYAYVNVWTFIKILIWENKLIGKEKFRFSFPFNFPLQNFSTYAKIILISNSPFFREKFQFCFLKGWKEGCFKPLWSHLLTTFQFALNALDIWRWCSNLQNQFIKILCN